MCIKHLKMGKCIEIASNQLERILQSNKDVPELLYPPRNHQKSLKPWQEKFIAHLTSMDTQKDFDRLEWLPRNLLQKSLAKVHGVTVFINLFIRLDVDYFPC